MYLWLKLTHLVSLILWLGPAIGAYIILLAAYRSKDAERTAWLERQTEKILRLEHVAFVALTLSGLSLWWVYGNDMWLKVKLSLFAYVLIFEIYDIYLHHFLLRRKIEAGEPVQQLKKPLAIATMPLLILIPLIIYIAVFKPHFV